MSIEREGNKMKVYVVSECIDGENGYREVIKVFSTLEKAKDFPK